MKEWTAARTKRADNISTGDYLIDKGHVERVEKAGDTVTIFYCDEVYDERKYQLTVAKDAKVEVWVLVHKKAGIAS